MQHLDSVSGGQIEARNGIGDSRGAPFLLNFRPVPGVLATRIRLNGHFAAPRNPLASYALHAPRGPAGPLGIVLALPKIGGSAGRFLSEDHGLSYQLNGGTKQWRIRRTKLKVT